MLLSKIEIQLVGTSTAGLYQAVRPSDLRHQEQPLLANALWSVFTEVNRRLLPAEISVAEDQVCEYLWMQMAVEPDPEDDEAVSIRRWFPKSGHERVEGTTLGEAASHRHVLGCRSGAP